MAEVVFNYDVVSLMNKAEGEPAARIITLDYLLFWDGRQWRIEDTWTGKISDVYVSVV